MVERGDRRSFLKAGGAAVGCLGLGYLVTNRATEADEPRREPARPGSTGIDLAPLLEGIDDGERLVLSRGTYELRRDVTVRADDWEVDGGGAVVKVYGEQTRHVDLHGSDWEFHHVAWEPQNEGEPSCWLRMEPSGAGYHLHHLAWTKEYRVPAGSGTDRGCLVVASESGSTNEITDIWMGEGTAPRRGNWGIAAWGDNDGQVWIRRSFLENFGTYVANSVYEGDQITQTGTVHFESCYFLNSMNHCVRAGSHFGETYVRDCVMHCTGLENVPTLPKYDGDRWFSGVWAWHGPVILENVHIQGAPDRAVRSTTDTDIRQRASVTYRSGEYTGALENAERITIADTVGHDPNVLPPVACVTSAREAYY